MNKLRLPFARICCLAVFLLFGQVTQQAIADKPRTRDKAENRDENLKRYKKGQADEHAKETLGIRVKYVGGNEPKCVITGFHPT